MKKRINLFSRKKRFDVFAAYAVKVRRYGTFVGILLFLVFAYVIYNIFTVQKQVQALSKQKQLYLSVLLNEKDIEANIRYFKGKQTQLITYEKDDAHFLPYYQVLLNVLESSTQSAVLDSVQIDKNRETSFTVRFSDYDSMLSFLKYVESPEFLQNFDSLTMSNLSLSRLQRGPATQGVSNKSNNKNFQLEFKGKFKQIKDEPS